MTSRKALLFALLLPSLAVAQEPVRLPLRVHVLQSAAAGPLTSNLDSAAVATLVQRANEIWSQAGISWHIESVLREQAIRSETYDSLLRAEIPRMREPLFGFVPRDHILEEGWNLFLIGDFGQIAGGVFEPSIHGVVLAARGMGVDLAPDGRGGATLAHELGHSLGLSHVPCDERRNIMALSCWRPEHQSSLSSEQIATAAAQATKQRPSSAVPPA